MEQVLVERLRHARGVVVGGLYDGRVLDQVHSDKDVVAAPQPGLQAVEEPAPLLGREVADGPAEKDHESLPRLPVQALQEGPREPSKSPTKPEIRNAG